MKNLRHQWRVVPVPATETNCALCGWTRACKAYDHDLRGHICGEDFDVVRQAEEVLAIAGLEQPTDSILEASGEQEIGGSGE